MDRDVQFYFERGLAPSTCRTYRAGINRFLKFCTAHHAQAPLPVSQSLLCYYITFLAKSGLAYGTIKTYLSAVRYLHVANDLVDPAAVPMPKMKMVANGIRKVQATSSHQKPRLPITPTILNQIRALWSPKAHDNGTIMLWAASCLCFFGFFWMGEITTLSDTAYDHARHLSYADIAVDRVSSPTMLR